MLFVLDNYDSFTYNLVQLFGELGAEPVVYRNDALTVAQVRALAGKVPMLGVCLGHQAIGAAFGGRVVRADRVMHGKTCPVLHESDELFEGIPNPVTGMRYHSLVLEPSSLPADLVITAWSGDRPKDAEIMAMKHRRHPIYGVQFHPESIGTEHGKRLLANFLAVARTPP